MVGQQVNHEDIQLNDLESSKNPEQTSSAMKIADFLGEENVGAVKAMQKTSSYSRKELHGDKEEIISQINQYGKTLRPLARVVGLTSSPNREQKQLVTMVEILKESNILASTPLRHHDDKESLIFAVPVNDRLPWFIVEKAPDEFVEDKRKGRNPSHRYYIVKYNDWKTT